MDTDINKEEVKINETVFTLRRRITKAKGEILSVSRSLEVNKRVVYCDKMTRDVFYSTLNNPDIFRLVELFSSGEVCLNIGDHTASRAKNGKRIIELFKRIWVKLRFHKLEFRFKLFKLSDKNQLLRGKSSA